MNKFLAAVAVCFLGVLATVAVMDRVVPVDRPMDRPVAEQSWSDYMGKWALRWWLNQELKDNPVEPKQRHEFRQSTAPPNITRMYNDAGKPIVDHSAGW